MKTILTFLAIFMALHTTAIAETLADLNGSKFQLNRASPNAMALQRLGTKLIKESMRSVKVVYDFSASGGASTAAIQLIDPDTGLAAYLPNKAIIRDCVVDVLTAPTSLGSATVALSSGKSAADLQAATAIASLTVGLHACVPVGSAATAIKLSADVIPTASVAVANLTAGKINVLIDYSLSE